MDNNFEAPAVMCYDHHPGAFSLIECLIALSLFILLFSLVIPKQKFLQQIFIENDLEKLYSTFSLLRKQAVASNKMLSLTFTPTANSYAYQLDGKFITQKLSPLVEFGFLPNVKGPPANPRTMITKPITFRTINDIRTVRFFSNGKVSAGTVYLVEVCDEVERSIRRMKALTCSISQVSFIRKYTYERMKSTRGQKKWVLR